MGYDRGKFFGEIIYEIVELKFWREIDDRIDRRK